MPVLAAREAMSRLSQRSDLAPAAGPAPAPTEAPTVTAPPVEPTRADEPSGKSIRLALAQLEVDKQHP
jgi:hypothetical protein